MLTILNNLIDAMKTQAQQDHPIETCGIIAGPKDSHLPLRLIPIRNIAQSSTFFEFDPQQQLRVWREMEALDEVPVVFYHSHTQSAAYPSYTDRLYASEPEAHYVIISTDPTRKCSVRSFRIIKGEVTEERIVNLVSYNNTIAC